METGSLLNRVLELRKKVVELGEKVEKRKEEALKKELPEKVRYVFDFTEPRERNLNYNIEYLGNFGDDLRFRYKVLYSGKVVFQFEYETDGEIDIEGYIPGEWEALLEDDYARALKNEKEYLEKTIMSIRERWGLE